jgi:hypothetical protein
MIPNACSIVKHTSRVSGKSGDHPAGAHNRYDAGAGDGRRKGPTE